MNRKILLPLQNLPIQSQQTMSFTAQYISRPLEWLSLCEPFLAQDKDTVNVGICFVQENF